MNTGKHLKIAGVLQIVHGIILFLFGIYGVVGNFFNPRSDSLEAGELPEVILIILILTAIFLAGGVQVWFGRSLVLQKQWTARVGGFILCVVSALHGGLEGIVIGGYTLWVLIMVRGENAKATEPIN